MLEEQEVIPGEERWVKLKARLLAAKPELESERARIITQSYKETEGEPYVIRRAKALRALLEQMTVLIGEDELIVANRSKKPRAVPVFPEMSYDWIEKELDSFETRPVDPFITPESVKHELREIFPYWKGKTVYDKIVSQFTPFHWHLLGSNVLWIDNNMYNGMGHILPDFPKIIKQGFKGIRDEILNKLEYLLINEPKNRAKIDFYNAALIVIEAAVSFSKRYSKEARRLVSITSDEVRKDELELIAQICEWVPENPARTFHEACQSYWIAHSICFIESDGMSISPGRFDQYMYPFYEKDIREGKLSKKRAIELLECLWIKFSELVEMFQEEWAYTASGFPMGQNLILGGQTPDGSDATNELSYLCLEVTERLSLPQPNVSVRLHRWSPKEFVFRACETSRHGNGMPEFFNDEIIIPGLMNRGIPLQDARDYAVVGCVEIGIPGRTEANSNPAYVNLAKILELATNNGVCRLTGEKVGIDTGDPRHFETFEEVTEAYCKQQEYFVRQLIPLCNLMERVHTEFVPTPFLSTMISDCIEKGLDVLDGGARFNFTSPQGVGIANVADSLSAIKKMVFEDQKVSMDCLLQALDENFLGHEDLQYMLKNCPKYGNDEDYVDQIARNVGRWYCLEIEKYRNPRGGIFQPGLYPVSVNVPLGKTVGATPDGRKAKIPLADGVSPSHESEKRGPTAVFKSVAKLDHILVTNGTLLNMKFHPRALDGRNGLLKFAALINTYFGLGGLHVQFNVISAETLREAQIHPELYRSLVVRVAGYSAFFTELYRELQEDIISRTEHGEV
ncbi:MAG: glycyl radical protein [Candidatus Atribacteria bacterium]|nr:glycyl radical protein [Candidatus Atribacteria bacterium]